MHAYMTLSEEMLNELILDKESSANAPPIPHLDTTYGAELSLSQVSPLSISASVANRTAGIHRILLLNYMCYLGRVNDV